MQMPVPGEVFQEKYQLVELLGKGGFAHVFRAIDVEIGRDVAIKVLAPDRGGYDEQVESRFMREARVIATLQDPHTITMFEFGKTPSGLLFMVFEYVRGRDLQQLLKEHGALPPHIARHILRQLLSALNEAHNQGILHRDIKPANVIVFEYMGDPWRVKLIDFGIAKPMSHEGRDVTQLTREGSVVGTPRYMAPEQFFGDTLTPSADIYSLGLVVHELLLGRPAISGTTSQELLRAAMATEPIRLPPLADSGALATIVDKMTERKPTDRYQTAAAVIAGLDALDRRPSQVSIPAVVMPARPASGSSPAPAAKTKGIWVALLGAAALCSSIVAAFVLSADRPETVARPAKPALPNALVKTAPQPRANVQAPDATVEALENDLGMPSGCGKSVSWRGPRLFRPHIGFETREYTVYVPSTYKSEVEHPAVLLFHNAVSDGRGVIENTRFGALADKKGLVLIAPHAQDATKPWYGADDMELTRLALSAARSQLCLDNDRLYALGHGGGGGFAVRARCEIPLSAVAISGTAEYEDDVVCEAEPTPFLRFYGTKDRHVPAAGGPGCFDRTRFRSAEVIARLWVERNAATAKPKVWMRHKGSKCMLWGGPAAFVSCALDGGHDWPTAPPPFEIPGCGSPPPDFPMLDTTWRFFEEHGRSLTAAPPEPE